MAAEGNMVDSINYIALVSASISDDGLMGEKFRKLDSELRASTIAQIAADVKNCTKTNLARGFNDELAKEKDKSLEKIANLDPQQKAKLAYLINPAEVESNPDTKAAYHEYKATITPYLNNPQSINVAFKTKVNEERDYILGKSKPQQMASEVEADNGLGNFRNFVMSEAISYAKTRSSDPNYIQKFVSATAVNLQIAIVNAKPGSDLRKLNDPNLQDNAHKALFDNLAKKPEVQNAMDSALEKAADDMDKNKGIIAQNHPRDLPAGAKDMHSKSNVRGA